MHNIRITMEKTVRTEKEFEVPDSIYEEIERTQRIPDDYFNRMEEIIEDTADDVEYDYAVLDLDKDRLLIDWL